MFSDAVQLGNTTSPAVPAGTRAPGVEPLDPGRLGDRRRNGRVLPGPIDRHLDPAIPLAAVVIRDSPKGDKDASGRIKTEEGVYTVADGKVRFAPIKTGLTGELDIEVENGLKDGATVISGPFKTLRTIKEGDRVKEMSEEKKKAMESGAGES